MDYNKGKIKIWIVIWKRVTYTIIVFNAVIYGVMTSPNLSLEEKMLLDYLDGLFLVYFVIELLLKIYCHKQKFFRNGWNLFDFCIVVSSILFAMSAISVLRAFRVLRVLKVVTTFSRLRVILGTLLEILPSMGWISGLLFIVYYVYAILGNQLFGNDYPEFFGSLGNSMFTLFQVMTLDAWSEQVARPMLNNQPWVWIYFFTFIILTAVVVLNIVVGIVVESVNRVSRLEKLRKAEIYSKNNEALSTEIEQIRIHLENVEHILMKK